MAVLGPTGPWTQAGEGAELVAPPASPRLPETLRVMTFNVEYRTRTDRLIDALRSHPELGRSDVLLLQEIGPSRAAGPARAAQLAGALGMGYAYAHGLAIVCRWPLHDVVVMALPRARLPFNQRRRIALAAEIEADGARLRLMSVHLDTRINVDDRIHQLAPAVADPHALQIVGGDMNTLPFRFAGGAVPIARADQAGRLDRYMRGLGFDAPVSGAGATHRVLKMRLDALFTRGFAPSVARVARELRISDHFPAWVDLAWPVARP